MTKELDFQHMTPAYLNDMISYWNEIREAICKAIDQFDAWSVAIEDAIKTTTRLKDESIVDIEGFRSLSYTCQPYFRDLPIYVKLVNEGKIVSSLSQDEFKLISSICEDAHNLHLQYKDSVNNCKNNQQLYKMSFLMTGYKEVDFMDIAKRTHLARS